MAHTKKKILVVGNWKMHPMTLAEAKRHAHAISFSAKKYKNVETVIAVPDIYLLSLATHAIKLAAQDASFEKVGAFTGEVSPWMLHAIGVSYAIIGHSERRALGESDELIARKVAASLKAGLTPILCVGERERGPGSAYLHVVRDQLHKCLAGISKVALSQTVIAYEPVWALSSTENRRDATAEDSREMAIYIRRIVSDMFRHPASVNDLRIIYGGSVTAKNAEEFLRDGGVGGVLPGRESLDPEKFGKIIEIASKIK